MNFFSALNSELIIHLLRMATALWLWSLLVRHGRPNEPENLFHWKLMQVGFAILIFAGGLGAAETIVQPGQLTIFGSTHMFTSLKMIGFIGGLTIFLLGFRKWLPAQTESYAHIKMLESQNQYSTLVDLSPDGIIIHRHGIILYTNAVVAQMIGLESPAELVGRKFIELVHPDFRDFAKSRINHIEKGALRNELSPLKLLDVNGKTLDVEIVSAASSFKGDLATHSVLRNISERLRSEVALIASERELRSIFDNMAELFFRADNDENIIRASGAAYDIFGYTNSQIMGLKLSALYADDDGRELFSNALKDANGKLRNFEIKLIKQDGSRFWAGINAQYHYDSSGKIAGIEGTLHDATETIYAREALSHLAMNDALTGLGNRRSFEARLNEALHRARRSKVNGAILYFDLDKFKPINDTYGHDFGDSVLRQASRRLKSIARETDFIARVGGDEFCLVAENIIDIDGMTRVAEKLIESISKPYQVKDTTVIIGISIGIMPFSGEENLEESREIVNAADNAMYVSKQNGGNTYHISKSL